jgi:hypothetical protein
MFKDIQRGFSKFFTSQRIIALIIFVVLAWGLLSYSGAKGSSRDLFGTGYTDASAAHGSTPSIGPVQPTQGPVMGGAVATPQVAASMPAIGSGYALQPVANPMDLLPNDQNSQWASLNPNANAQGNILSADLLQAGYHIGLDTIGQTLRNPNLQLRSDPLISKAEVGPWNQSTIEPDVGRVPLEIGQGPK